MTEIFNMLVQTLKDNLSEEFTVTSAIVRKKSVCQDSGKKTWTHPLHPKYQESPSHT